MAASAYRFDRKVALSGDAKKRGQYVAVSTLELEAETTQHIWLEGVDFPLSFLQIGQVEDVAADFQIKESGKGARREEFDAEIANGELLAARAATAAKQPITEEWQVVEGADGLEATAAARAGPEDALLVGDAVDADVQPAADDGAEHERQPDPDEEEVFHRSRIFPTPVLLISCITGSFVCIATIVDTLLFSFAPSLIPNSMWWYTIGGYALICIIICAVAGVIVTSETDYEEWRVDMLEDRVVPTANKHLP